MVLTQWEIQTASSRTGTRATVSTYYNGKNYTTSVSLGSFGVWKEVMELQKLSGDLFKNLLWKASTVDATFPWKKICTFKYKVARQLLNKRNELIFNCWHKNWCKLVR